MLYRKFKFLCDKFRFLYYFIQYICALFLAPFFYKKEAYQHLWLIAERGVDARDNGYHLYSYIRKFYPERNVVYVISDNSIDKVKVESIGNTVKYRSFRHMLMFVLAEVKISTHIMGFSADMYFFKLLDQKLKIPGKKVFLQHGITINNAKYLYANEVNLDLFVCGAKKEYETISKEFGYKKGVVQLLGFCRYDALPFFKARKKTRTILVMPTWRLYLGSLSKSSFKKSEYYQRYQSLLNNFNLESLLERYECTLKFYPHYEIHTYLDCFKKKSDRVIILNGSEDVQENLIEADILITDYSSVHFDFAYMNKPILYYQFDKEIFFKKHHGHGKFSFEQDGFGTVISDESDLLIQLEKCLQGSGCMEEIYRKRMESFFSIRDNCNCKRNYDAIANLLLI